VNICWLKVAVTDLAAFMFTVHVAPETESHPVQLVNVDPVSGVAVRVTTVPLSTKAEQVAPQSSGGLELELTVPLPLPAFAAVKDTFSVKLLVVVAMPPGVVTLSGPVVAPAGTVAWIDVAEITA
jgi:hypothetical protein